MKKDNTIEVYKNIHGVGKGASNLHWLEGYLLTNKKDRRRRMNLDVTAAMEKEHM